MQRSHRRSISWMSKWTTLQLSTYCHFSIIKRKANEWRTRLKKIHNFSFVQPNSATWNHFFIFWKGLQLTYLMKRASKQAPREFEDCFFYSKKGEVIKRRSWESYNLTKALSFQLAFLFCDVPQHLSHYHTNSLQSFPFPLSSTFLLCSWTVECELWDPGTM